MLLFKSTYIVEQTIYQPLYVVAFKSTQGFPNLRMQTGHHNVTEKVHVATAVNIHNIHCFSSA